MRKSDLIRLLEDQVDYQAETIVQLRDEVAKWRNSYTVLMHGVWLMTLPTEPGSDAAAAQTHTRDEFAALSADWLTTVGMPE